MEVEHCIRGDGEEFGTSYTVLKEPWIKGGQTIRKELMEQIKVLKELLKDDKEDRDTSTTH